MKITLAEAFRAYLRQSEIAVISYYDLNLLVAQTYRTGQIGEHRPGIKLRTPTDATFTYTIRRLLDHHVLVADPDFGQPIFRVVDVVDWPAEAVCCTADPFCYLSHFSAMQRYGLTNRNPVELTLTTPQRELWKQLAEQRMRQAWAELLGTDDLPQAMQQIGFPDKVRERSVTRHTTRHPSATQPVRETNIRISSIGATFLDMLSEPAWCGGMAHVLEVWEEHAPTYLEEIISAVDKAPTKLAKVRAGYILSERLGLPDPRILAWHAFAQRGASQKLDPERPYAPTFSQHWMLSLNV